MSGTDSPLAVTRDGHIETWTIDRPDERNPITAPEMAHAFVEAVDRATHDLDVRCIVLTGAGRAFSGGGNIKEIRAGQGMFGAPPHAAAAGYRATIQRLARAVFHCEVPIIAAVNGPAIGAGCDLTLMCDVRVASTSAAFAESFVRLGLVPGDGGAWLLSRLVGSARAAELTFTGRRIDAHTALAWGLVSEVVEPAELLTTATALAREVAANPPLAVRAAKRLMHAAEHQRFDDALELAAVTQAVAHHTEDHRNAVADPPAPFVAR